jgi:CRISPR-associated endoribonuclease Cas6
MRIKITLSAEKHGAIDFNYQHQIQGLIYSFLSSSDPDYSSWLHEQGFIYEGDKNFKFFVFSGIIFHGAIKITPPFSPSLIKRGTGGVNGFAFIGSPSNPFTLSFQIASPVHQFIQHLIEGIFKEGREIKLGRQPLQVYRVETLPDPLGLNSAIQNPQSEIHLKPLQSPLFVKKPMPAGERDIYLFPGDKDYEELLNQNLIHKYETLYGKQYEDLPLKFEFSSAKGKSIKSFKVFKNGRITGEIKGTLQPFTASGSADLIKIGLECGFGQNNSMGCGYVEAVQVV